MRVVSFLLKHSSSTLILAIIAGIASGAANTGLLAVLNAGLASEGASRRTLMWWFVGLCLFLPVTRCISEVLLNRMGQEALYDLRLKLCGQILGAPLRQLEQLGPHRLLAALTDDVPTITNVVTVIPILCISIAVTITCLIYLGILSWMLLLAVLIFMVLGVITYQIPVLKAMKAFAHAREQADSLLNHFRALTQGTKELKLHRNRRRAFLSDQLSKTAAAMKQFNIAGLKIYTVSGSWGQVLVFVVIGLVVFWLPTIQPTDANTLTGYALTLLYLMTPLQVIMNLMPTLGRVNVALKKIEDLGLELTSSKVETEGASLRSGASRWQSLELAGITHEYSSDTSDSNFVLGPIDLKLNPGEMVFIVGGNGSGKTTLAKLITGLYTPEKGEIRFDGEPITDDNRESYRQLFSVVFSDFYLFESLLGLHAPELDERAREYLERFRLHQKVKVSDGSLSTIDLSQGQRKRLALLTAYLEDRPIYLFDEWAADQDPSFKEIFYLQLLPELKARGKTVIVISHDDKYYHLGDRIIKLEYGKIEYNEPKVDLYPASLKLGM
ncbi:MAG TPA: cyclic peptide export ABC transporter [Blastocatellia bacterium]|nr:cyclic peptide export ABC transporter [Blastocatellia bacterium]